MTIAVQLLLYHFYYGHIYQDFQADFMERAGKKGCVSKSFSQCFLNTKNTQQNMAMNTRTDKDLYFPLYNRIK